MSQVIMLFLFPLGLYFYFFKERPDRANYEKIFTDFEANIQNNGLLLDTQKLQIYKEMLLKNNYKIVQVTPTTVIGETRIFSMSLFAMSLGVFYIGAVIYIIIFKSPRGLSLR